MGRPRGIGTYAAYYLNLLFPRVYVCARACSVVRACLKSSMPGCIVVLLRITGLYSVVAGVSIKHVDSAQLAYSPLQLLIAHFYGFLSTLPGVWCH